MIKFENLKTGDLIGSNDIEIGIKNGLIVDITKGGLLNGNNHEKGGIKVIIYNENIRKYYLVEFEGKEFVVNPKSSKENLERLIEINKKSSQFHNERKKIVNQHYSAISNDPKIIVNCDDRICYAPYTFVVNIVSTSKHIDELIIINKQFNY